MKGMRSSPLFSFLLSCATWRPERFLFAGSERSPLQVARLSDGLDLSVKKYATEIADNKKAREEINELRRERKRFKELMADKKARVTAIDRQVREVVGESQMWLEERGDHAARIEELQHSADTAQEEFFAQCRELKHVMRAFDTVRASPILLTLHKLLQCCSACCFVSSCFGTGAVLDLRRYDRLIAVYWAHTVKHWAHTAVLGSHLAGAHMRCTGLYGAQSA